MEASAYRVVALDLKCKNAHFFWLRGNHKMRDKADEGDSILPMPAVWAIPGVRI